MKLSRNLAKLGLAAAAAVGLLVTGATSASATNVYDMGHGAGSCPSGYVCLWSEGNFIQGGTVNGAKFGAFASNQNTGDMGKLQGRDGGGDKGMQDTASSIVNNTGSHICFYEHNWYGGAEFKIGPWEQWPGIPAWINDKISSFKFC
ncbi:peptidase inhibitor family I36 protein [Kitasatospora sp. NPDC048298]|uniref:peptidase inhibitor family I36 protein n=1 Tax=Kitasatospora sp. NPDC048298 TaxID=3364049 RepID=UPI00371A9BA8